MKQILGLLTLGLCLAACGQRNQVPPPREQAGSDRFVLKGKDLEMAVDACVQANSKILNKSVNTEQFCRCLVPKMVENFKSNPKEMKALLTGDVSGMSNEQMLAVRKLYQTCMAEAATGDSTAAITVTPHMADVMRRNIKYGLKGTEAEQTHDVDKFCDCMIDSLQTNFSAKEVMQPNFEQTDKYQQMLQQCLSRTKKK
jgi:hypothetical protein